MNHKVAQPWINAGYEIFAKYGPSGLKIEQLSKLVNKSKSSFYHHFADLEVFTSILLEKHKERAVDIAFKIKQHKSSIQDIIQLILEIKTDFFFNRQLRLNSSISSFKQCFEEANHKVIKELSAAWAKYFGLENKKQLSKVIMKLTVENFYLRASEDVLNYDWMISYFNEVKSMIAEINKSSILKTA